MLYFKFELILIKIGLFINFKVAQKLGQRHCTKYMVISQILSKMAMREFSIFIIFSDAYTCSYVVFQF